MAYLKIKWRKDIPKNQGMSAKEYEKYLLKERGTELVANAYNCVIGYAISQFEMTQAFFGKNKPCGSRNVNVAFEVIHSFSPEESKLLSAEKVNSMGMELAKRYFPGHEFTVVTHTDTDKTHNHILVNPINEKTGKRDVINKKKHLYNLRTISDEIARENGLSIIKETDKSRNKRLPEKVREIQRRGGNSYRLDLFQKADFARSYATNFDEYVSLLNELSVQVAITEKTISYYYMGHKKGIRGKRLGTYYDKPGLIKKFRSNDELFEKQPQVRRKIRDAISNFRDGREELLDASNSRSILRGDTQKLKEKTGKSYTGINHYSRRSYLPLDHALGASIIPIGEIRKASNSNILEYCKTHNIACKTNRKGETVLKGREYVVINGNRWVNTSNKTTGSLIEFVSLHDDVSFLGAISRITDNKNLLLLEEYFGEVKRPYKSFYVPIIQKEKQSIAEKKLSQFFSYNRINKRLSDDLFRQKRVQVDKKGGIWFYLDDEKKEAVHYTLDSDKGYKAQYYGDKEIPFVYSYRNEKRITVYTDYLNFLRVSGRKVINGSFRSSLVLKGLDERALHIFLSTRPNIKSIKFIESENQESRVRQTIFFNCQKEKLKSFDISVSSFSVEKAIQKERGLGLEL